jgi:hypothetical protein
MAGEIIDQRGQPIAAQTAFGLVDQQGRTDLHDDAAKGRKIRCHARA